MRILLVVLMGLASLSATAQTAPTPAPEGARLYFISPKDGETVRGEVKVRFGLSGMGVAPAGVAVEGTGHHHLLIDVEELPPLDRPIPADEHHVHFGKGQTETVLRLAPGRHTLQLLLGDHLHRPHQPPVISERITIEVAE
ncbi:MAG: rod shape-determining protein RodA [Lysobacteraceae bacterium]|nr:MAG: rod shape-determining protein RodA [Xanthomonadaceae bacterium]